METNKAEKKKEFYDHAYQKGGYNQMYAKHYRYSPYITIWEKAIELLKETEHPTLVEIGCGIEQFANMLFDHGFHQYKGIDFSDEAIRFAKHTNREHREKFNVDDAYTSEIIKNRMIRSFSLKY